MEAYITWTEDQSLCCRQQSLRGLPVLPSRDPIPNPCGWEEYLPSENIGNDEVGASMQSAHPVSLEYSSSVVVFRVLPPGGSTLSHY